MAQTRELKKRIKSVTNTQKVTHAMELVAAAKMRKAQSQALLARPYSFSLSQVLSTIKEKTHKSLHPLLKENKGEKQLIVLVTSDRGLAGGLNINLFREILREEPKNATYITVGKKAQNFIVKSNSTLLASYDSEQLQILDLARNISQLVMDSYINKDFSKISLLYPHFDSTAIQTPKWVQLLPLVIKTEETTQTKQITDNLLFEPSVKSILSTLLPHQILTNIYQILLEAKASEHSSRMIAMKNATDAADDLIDDLTLTYNQARQESITKELLDIVTAQRAFQ